MGQTQSNETSRKENHTSLHDYSIRLSVIGDFGTGKSSLINRFTTGSFPFIELRSTCKSSGFFGRTLSVDDETVRVVFEDTFGSERFRRWLGFQHFRGVKGFLVVYDATSQLSFDNVEDWLKEIEEKAEDVPIVLIGNKCDLHSKKVVTFTEAKKKADRLGIPLIETSACTDKNVEQAFMSLIVKSIQNMKDRELETNEKAEGENKQTQNVFNKIFFFW